MTNRALSAVAGITSSLRTNLMPSATDCNKPKGPIGSDSVLNAGRNLALDPNQVHARGEHAPQHHHDGHHRVNPVHGLAPAAAGGFDAE
jgi:hypothetical protein